MMVSWKGVSETLRATMLAHELRLPECPIADGRWHNCAGGGHCLLFPDLLIAIYCGAGNGVSPIVWQTDDRLLTLALEQRIADATAQRPVLVQRNSSILQPQDDHGANQDSKKLEAISHRLDDGPSTEPIAAKEPGSGDPSSAPPSEVLRMFGVRPGSAVVRAMDALAEWLATGPVRTVELRSAQSKLASRGQRCVAGLTCCLSASSATVGVAQVLGGGRVTRGANRYATRHEPLAGTRLAGTSPDNRR